MNRLFIAIVALFASVVAFAQEGQKLGYADTDYILTQMPDAKKVETELKAHGDQLQAQMRAKADDYQKKMNDYNTNAAKWVDAVRQDKESELQMLQQQFQKFQQDAEASFAKKQQDLMAPMIDKVGNAIAEVAKENSYSFIITTNTIGGTEKVLLYKDAQFDISNLVLKKLGVTPTAAAPNTKPQPK